VAQTIAEAKAEQAAVNLYDQVDQIATSLQNLKHTVDRATGFKDILLANAEPSKSAAMLAEVVDHSDVVWAANVDDFISVIDRVAGMLSNPATPGQTHTRNSLLDTLRTS
tara:strand:- start:15164 stop:15493 length:330 start_codon:yes stop_codon:yes gene_type:complete